MLYSEICLCYPCGCFFCFCIQLYKPWLLLVLLFLFVYEVMPDFVQVYNFLGSVFDPSTSCHLQKLREMDPIDVETV